MFKSYYASILIAVGAALLIAAPGNWMLQIVAYALLSGGALMQQAPRAGISVRVLQQTR